MGWRRWLLVAAVAFGAIVLVGGVLIWQRAASFNETVSSASLFPPRLFGALNGSERVNIALFGYADENRSGAFLADSMSILSIDPATDTTTAIAIPRDLWVEDHDGLPGNGRINEAFAVGYRDGGYEKAGERAALVSSHVTGLPIHGWIALDFDGFREMVDAVGGVTIDNPRAFNYPLTNRERDEGTYTGFFAEGPIDLAGSDALFYVRVRYTDVVEERSDFARSVRQHRVLAAIRDKITDAGLAAVPRGLALMDALSDGLRTDLSVLDLYLVSNHLSPDRRVELGEGEILEATRNSVGQYVLVVIGRTGPDDYGPVREYISKQLEAGDGAE